jgi:predicted metal-dependent phosphoesterase TrpH
MGQRFDLHLHTRRYSACSVIDPDQLVRLAARAGLDGVVITEHHKIWPRGEIAELLEKAAVPGFMVLAGFEYTSAAGDVLIYGLEPGMEEAFEPGGDPAEAVARAHDLGAACVAAHPTRAGLSFGPEIAGIPFDALEVKSSNLLEHEQRLAIGLAKAIGKPGIAASDAHQPRDIGRFHTVFTVPVTGMPDLQEALRHGTFNTDPESATGRPGH